MGTLSAQGYIVQTAAEIESEMMSEAIAQVVGFTGLPSELRTDIIQESVIPTLKMDAMVSDLLNGVAPTYANDFLFEQFGQSFGIPMKMESNTSVTVVFSGTAGQYIPINSACQNIAGTKVVYTITDGIIGASGSVSLVCESTSAITIGIGEITVMADPITGITLTNPATGVEGVPAETIEAYRSRIQNTLQGPRMGQVSRAYELLEKVTGVVPLLIFFRQTVITKTLGGTPTAFPGIEAVVGGGADEDVALALFNSFLQTKNLISDPDQGTTTDVTVSVYNNTFPVSFTRPKHSLLEIDLTIVLEGATASQDMVEQMLATAFTAFFAGLQIGTLVNKFKMDEIIFMTLEPIGIEPENLKTITYTIKIDGSGASFVNDYIPTAFDQYLTLDVLSLALS